MSNAITFYSNHQNRPVEGRALAINGDARFWVFHFQDTGERIDSEWSRRLLERRARKFAGLPVAWAI